MTMAALLGLALVLGDAPQEPKACRSRGDSTSVKKFLDLQKWPGKKGPLKAGFVFDPKDYPDLKDFTSTQDEWNLEAKNALLPAHIRRTLVLTKNGGPETRIELHAEIRVLATSTNDAHLALAIHFLSYSTGGLEDTLKLGSSISLGIGDVCVIPKGFDLALMSRARGIAFARNNVVVILRTTSEPPASGFDLSALARVVDAKIIGQADRTAAQLAALAPAIAVFQPQTPTLRTFSTTAVTLTATEPRGLRLQFELSAGFGRLEPGAPPMFFSTAQTGTSNLKCIAFSQALLFAVAESSVTVQE
jgi:hypothetical protein